MESPTLNLGGSVSGLSPALCMSKESQLSRVLKQTAKCVRLSDLYYADDMNTLLPVLATVTSLQ